MTTTETHAAPRPRPLPPQLTAETVKPNETLWSIAKRLAGEAGDVEVMLVELRAANPHLCTRERKGGDLLFVGDRIYYPTRQSTEVVPAKTIADEVESLRSSEPVSSGVLSVPTDDFEPPTFAGKLADDLAQASAATAEARSWVGAAGAVVQGTAATLQANIDSAIDGFETMSDSTAGSLIGGFISGATSLVTGVGQLVGGAMQLADAPVRERTTGALKDLAAHPGEHLAAVGSDVRAAFREDWAHALGKSVALVAPAGLAVRSVLATRAAATMTAVETSEVAGVAPLATTTSAATAAAQTSGAPVAAGTASVARAPAAVAPSASPLAASPTAISTGAHDAVETLLSRTWDTSGHMGVRPSVTQIERELRKLRQAEGATGSALNVRAEAQTIAQAVRDSSTREQFLSAARSALNEN